MSLSCSVTNQGRFRWQWTSRGYSPQVSDDTRTSMTKIPLTVESVGEYTCTASYHPDTRLDPSPVTGTFAVDLESKSIIHCTLAHKCSYTVHACTVCITHVLVGLIHGWLLYLHGGSTSMYKCIIRFTSHLIYLR